MTDVSITWDVVVEATHMTKGGQRYRALFEGDEIVSSSREAGLEAARVLIESGAHCDDRYRILGSDGHVLMHGRLGSFASMQILESSSVSIRAVQWAPNLFGHKDDGETPDEA